MLDLYQEITNRIIVALESGVAPWKQGWVGGGQAIKHISGEPYSLLNQLLLPKPGEYLSFKQAIEEGGHVRKGEKSSMVVFWKWLPKLAEDGQPIIGENGKPEQVPYLRYYSVFHIDQCEGIAAKHTEPAPDVVKPDEKAEQIINGYLSRSGVRLRHVEGESCYYTPSTDTVTLPLVKQFLSTDEYYTAAFHELTHSTGHESRLKRLDTTAHFGGQLYSKEELVAEIGAATLVNIVGLETKSSFENNAAYIKHWLAVLKDDKRLIVSAAGKAEKAVQLILGEQNEDAE